MATAIAGQYNLNIYLLSLSNEKLNDHWLESLFDQLPTSAGIQREDMTKPKRKKQQKSRSLFSEEDDRESGQQHVTLSGLLNVLDGIQAAEGRITLMTSNSPDSLEQNPHPSPANSSPESSPRPPTSSRRVASSHFRRDIPGPSQKPSRTRSPPAPYTPAEVQGHLLQNRTDPVAAVATAAQFAKATLEAKIQGANVAGFANEVSGSSSSPDDKAEQEESEKAGVTEDADEDVSSSSDDPISSSSDDPISSSSDDAVSSSSSSTSQEALRQDTKPATQVEPTLKQL
ncbi:hypothetical protein LTR65_006062 [Meristemomyces frigidus]